MSAWKRREPDWDLLNPASRTLRKQLHLDDRRRPCSIALSRQQMTGRQWLHQGVAAATLARRLLAVIRQRRRWGYLVAAPSGRG